MLSARWAWLEAGLKGSATALFFRISQRGGSKRRVELVGKSCDGNEQKNEQNKNKKKNKKKTEGEGRISFALFVCKKIGRTLRRGLR